MMMIMKYIKHTYFRHVITIIALCLTVLMSCFHDDALEMCEEKGLIVVNLAMDGLNTRAAGDQLFTGDEAITKVRIFVFTGDILETNQLFISGENQFNNPFVLEVVTGVKDIYVVANESEGLSTQLASVTTMSELKGIMAETISETSGPLSFPLVMTGSQTGVTVDVVEEPTRNTANVKLTRIASKISLKFKKDTDADVLITKVSLLNNSGETTIWDNGATTSGPPYWDWKYTLVTPLTLTNTETAVSGKEDIYLYENLAGELNGATKLEVEALYNGIQTKYSVYINEVIESPGSEVPGDPFSSTVNPNDHLYKILRNYHYQVNGTISGLGEYTSISVKVKILPWTVHEYAVPLE